MPRTIPRLPDTPGIRARVTFSASFAAGRADFTSRSFPHRTTARRVVRGCRSRRFRLTVPSRRNRIEDRPTDHAPPMPPQQPRSREWAPRLWEGSDYFAWLRLLARNRFAVEPPYWYIAAVVSVSTFAHTALRWVQHGLYGDRVAWTEVPNAPLFVIGHWRTGTTLLHELLIL